MRYRETLVILSVLFIWSLPSIHAQINIKNGNFEHFKSGQLENVHIISESPDYFRKSIKYLPSYYSNAKFNARFPLQGSDGIGYVGIAGNCGGSECFALEIRDTLKQGIKYIVSFDVYMPAIYSNSNVPYYNYALVETLPVATEHEGTYRNLEHAKHVTTSLNPRLTWINIRDTITANGTEKHIVLFNPLPSSCDASYYLLYDKVSVFEVGQETNLQVFFNHGSSKLTDLAKEKLTKSIAFLKRNEVQHIELIGFSDGLGASKQNLVLSRKRAENVQDFMALHLENVDFNITYRGDSLAIKHKQDAQYRKVQIVPNFEYQVEQKRVPKQVIDSLIEIYNIDQDLRKKPIPFTDSILQVIFFHDSIARDFLCTVFDRYGYVGLSAIGGKYKDALGILLLHQTTDILTKYKENIRNAYLNAECSNFLYPYLLDKEQLSLRGTQVFGTQFYIENGEAILYPIEDEAHVDRRRKQFRLKPIEHYKHVIQESSMK